MSGFIDTFNTTTQTAFYALMDDALWEPTAADPVAIKGEFNDTPLNDELADGVDIGAPQLRCYTVDVPGIVSGERVTVQGAQYVIADVLAEGDGMTRLVLRLP